MTFLIRLTTVLLVTFALCGSSIAQSRQHITRSLHRHLGRGADTDRLNAGNDRSGRGLLEGAPIRFATEIARRRE